MPPQQPAPSDWDKAKVLRAPTQSEWDAAKPADQSGPSFTDVALALPKGVFNTINPIPLVKTIAQRGLLGTVSDLLQAQGNLGKKAVSDVQNKRYVDALRHGLLYLVPMLGPGIAASGDRLEAATQRGDVPAALEATGEQIGFGLPGLLAGRTSRIAPKIGASQAPEVAAAVQFGQREGIPIDLATATGNRAARMGQMMAGETPFGSGVVTRAQQAQADALEATGKRMADRANPVPVTAEQAGTNATQAVRGQVAAAGAEANDAYDALRQIEAANKDNVAARVDLRPVKKALVPIFDRLMRQLPVTQQQASSGLKAIQNIIQGDDFAALSTADADLSAIKTLARADMPELRTVSQGLAANAVSQLETAVMRGASSMGPDAVAALKAGRAATIKKYAMADVLDSLKAEPVKAFQQATAPQDAAIAHLRELAKIAPDAPAEIGRAWLDQVLAKATQEGGFEHAAKIQADWQRLGPETKKVMFGAALTNDLDNFFLLAKKMGENPNPSGSGRTVVALLSGAYAFTDPITGIAVNLSAPVLAKLMYSPRFVRAMTRGASVQVGNKAAAVAAASELLQAAREQGVSGIPAFAGKTQDSAQR